MTRISIRTFFTERSNLIVEWAFRVLLVPNFSVRNNETSSSLSFLTLALRVLRRSSGSAHIVRSTSIISLFFQIIQSLTTPPTMKKSFNPMVSSRKWIWESNWVSVMKLRCMIEGLSNFDSVLFLFLFSTFFEYRLFKIICKFTFHHMLSSSIFERWVFQITTITLI